MYNENINYYEIIYLQTDTGECINVTKAQNENENLEILYIDVNKNSKVFHVRKSEGSVVFDENIETNEKNLPSTEYPFTAKIDGKEMTFKAVKTPVTGAKKIVYYYSEDSPIINDDIGDIFVRSKNFMYETTIFALNNENNLESINKINLDINKDFGITDASTFNDLTKLLKDHSIIRNRMYGSYNEWKVKNECEYAMHSLCNGFSIYHLSEKIIHIRYVINAYDGGMLGMYGSRNLIYSLETGNRLGIGDLITDLKNPDLLNLIKDKLLKIEGICKPFLNALSLEYNNFYLTSKGLVFTWGLYELGHRGIGEPEVLISSEEIKPYLKDEYKTIFE